MWYDAEFTGGQGIVKQFESVVLFFRYDQIIGFQVAGVCRQIFGLFNERASNDRQSCLIERDPVHV